MDQVQGRRQPQGLAGVSLLGRPDTSQQDGNGKRLKEFKVEMSPQAQGGSLPVCCPSRTGHPDTWHGTRGTGHTWQATVGSHG